MEKNVVKTVNWFDIKDDVKIIKEDKVSKCINSLYYVFFHNYMFLYLKYSTKIHIYFQ